MILNRKARFRHYRRLERKRTMKNLLFGLLIFCACKPAAPVNLSEQAAKEIREADLAMNAMATRDGFNKALLAYADDNLIKPQDGDFPVVGKQALTEHYAGKDGTKDITWSPFKVEAAASGDQGYSLGNWKYTTSDTTAYGMYYTMWKKQPDGNWKWTVDGGHNMPGEYKMPN